MPDAALVSSNYLASDYLTEVEMNFALQRMRDEGVVVIPIILRPCLWHDTPIGQLQVLPRNSKALTESQSIDEELMSLVHEIDKVIQHIETKEKDSSTKIKDIVIDSTSKLVFADIIRKNPASIEETLAQITASLSILFEEVKTIKNKLEASESQNFSSKPETKRNMDKNVKYQVGLSFAGEDRNYVSKVADELLKLQILVFYDEYETVDLWGKDLYQHLSDVYKNKCQYCVIFISKHYAEKLWTKHELKNAQAKAFEENREYILPARFDDTELPGMLPTVGYVNCNKLAPNELAQKIYEKVLRTPSV